MTDFNPMAAFAESMTPKRAITYLRVSTTEQASKGGQSEVFSIPAQRDANKKKAQSMGLSSPKSSSSAASPAPAPTAQHSKR